MLGDGQTNTQKNGIDRKIADTLTTQRGRQQMALQILQHPLYTQTALALSQSPEHDAWIPSITHSQHMMFLPYFCYKLSMMGSPFIEGSFQSLSIAIPAHSSISPRSYPSDGPMIRDLPLLQMLRLPQPPSSWPPASLSMSSS